MDNNNEEFDIADLTRGDHGEGSSSKCGCGGCGNNSSHKYDAGGTTATSLKLNTSNKNLNGSANSSRSRNRRRCIDSCRMTLKKIKRALPCLLAWTLLLGTSAIYFTFVSPMLLHILDRNYTIFCAITAAHALVLFYASLNFIIAIFMDPGRYVKAVEDSLDDSFKSPLYKNVLIKNSLIKTKWCSSCNFYRPLRCSHCSVCNSCIDQFDHHCPWLCNCVGRRNYRFFFQFLFFLVVHMCAVMAFCIFEIVKEPTTHLSTIIAIGILILDAVLIFPIGGLFIFHLMLIGKSRTTNEQVTGKYKGLQLFQHGLCKNFAVVLCASTLPRFEKHVVVRKKSRLMVDESCLSANQDRKVADVSENQLKA